MTAVASPFDCGRPFTVAVNVTGWPTSNRLAGLWCSISIFTGAAIAGRQISSVTRYINGFIELLLKHQVRPAGRVFRAIGLVIHGIELPPLVRRVGVVHSHFQCDLR